MRRTPKAPTAPRISGRPAGSGTAGVSMMPVAVKDDASGLPATAWNVPTTVCPSEKLANAVDPIRSAPVTVTEAGGTPSTSMSKVKLSPTEKSLNAMLNDVSPLVIDGRPTRPVSAALVPDGVKSTPPLLLHPAELFGLSVSKQNPGAKVIPKPVRLSPAVESFENENDCVNVLPSIRNEKDGTA